MSKLVIPHFGRKKVSKDEKNPTPPIKTQTISWWGSLVDCFSRKRAKKRRMMIAKEACANALIGLKQKEIELKQKYDTEDALCLEATNRKKIEQAIDHLKKKKFFQKQLDKIKIHTFNIEIQISSIDENDLNNDVFETIKGVSKALKKSGRAFEIKDVETTVDNLQDLLEEVAECSQVLQDEISIHLPGGEDDYDSLRQEIMDHISPPPSVPPTAPALLSSPPVFPIVPEHRIVIGEEEEEINKPVVNTI